MGTAKRASAHTSSTKLARPLDVHHAEAMLRLPVEKHWIKSTSAYGDFFGCRAHD
jgi:hypothetical protein